jgi:hypothetical protein
MDTPQLKKSFLFCLGLVVILVAIDRLLAYGVAHSPYTYYHKVNLIANHEADPQIACFGSSVGDVALNPTVLKDITGYSAYNFCIDGTRFKQYNGLIETLNDYANNCQLVIMAETFFSLSGIDQLTDADRFLAHIDNDHIYRSLYSIQPALAWKMRYVPFYKFVVARQVYYKASALGLKATFDGQEVGDPLLGYTPKYKSWETGLDSLNRISKPLSIQIDSSTVREYRSTIALLRKKGKKVLIIIPPIHAQGLALLPGLDVLRKTLASMEGEGVYFRDFSSCDLSADKRYFYNNSHVNDLGAKAFSAKLALSLDSIMNESAKKPVSR